MSLDLYLRKYCLHCGHNETVYHAAYTYNVSPMWYKIFPDDNGMVEIEGITGKETHDKLVYARKILQENPDEFKKLNPPNGFGSYEGFLRFIEGCINASAEYPELKWEAWR